MPATQARGGFKTKLMRDDGTGNFTQIAEVKDIQAPDKMLLMEDATNMDSEDYVERVPVGLHDTSAITFQINHIEADASQASLEQDLDGAVKRNWRIVHPSGAKRISFSGYVTKMGAAYPVKGIMVRDCEITPTGKPVKENHP